MNRAVAIGGALVGVGVIAYALFSSKTDEEQILERLDALEAAVQVDGDSSTNLLLRTGAVNGAFEEIFTKDVRFSIPELTSGERGRSELAALAAKSGTYFTTLDVDFGGTDISIAQGEEAADVNAIATVRATRSGGRLERDDRRVKFRFVNTDDGWLIDTLRVAPRGDSAFDDAS